MNNNESANRMIAVLPACVLATSLFFVVTAASAQGTAAAAQNDTHSAAATTSDATQPSAEAAPAPAQGAQATAEGEEYFDDLPLQVGDATLNLLAWQRSGEIASATSRPIAGSVASRSYERYLKSFEHSIPEQFSSSVKSTSEGSGTSGR